MVGVAHAMKKPAKTPPSTDEIISHIASALLSQYEKDRLKTYRLSESPVPWNMIEGWAERVIFEGPTNHRERYLRKDAMSSARAVVAMLIERSYL